MSPKPDVLILGQAESLPSSETLNGFVLTFIGKDPPSPEWRGKFASIRTLDVPDLFDVEELETRTAEIESLARELIAVHGPLAGIVATSEPAIVPGAILREKLGLPGLGVHKADILRDKFLMKKALMDAGYDLIPAFCAVEIDDNIESLTARGGFAERPLVLKPRRQAASWGVHVCKSQEDLTKAIVSVSLSGKAYQAEEFIKDEIIHIDGVVRQGRLLFVAASRYVFNCLQWAQHGTPMASVLIDDRDLAHRIVDFTQKTTSALGLLDNVFHLEAFLSPKGDLRFLEIAGRPGGAGIVPTLRMVYGVDLSEEALRCDLGIPSGVSHGGMLADGKLPSGGWAVTPLGCASCCRVRGIKGLEHLPQALHYAEILPPGKVFNAVRNEGLPSGKFYFKAGSAQEVVDAIYSVVSGYCLTLDIA